MDYNTFKYNLYELLDLKQDASLNDIKKRVNKLIIELHPDKKKYNSSELNIEIFDYVMKAKDILTNAYKRASYDDYLHTSNGSTFIDLKKSANEYYDVNKPEKLDSNQLKKKMGGFKEMSAVMDEKHGVKDISYNVNSAFLEVQKRRSNEINIEAENIVGNKDFNKRFEEKIKNKQTKNDIITYDKNKEIIPINYDIDNNTSLSSFNSLYINDNISSTSYGSIEEAFKVNEVIIPIDDGLTIKQRMQRYRAENPYNSF